MHLLDIYIVVLPALHVAGVRPNPLDFFSIRRHRLHVGGCLSQTSWRLVALPACETRALRNPSP